MRLPALLTSLLLASAAHSVSTASVAAQPDISGPDLPPAMAAGPADEDARGSSPATAGAGGPAPDAPDPLFPNLVRDTDSFTLVNEKHGLSFHKPMFFAPATWSPQYEGQKTEVIFQISLKQRLLNRNLFFGYTQKSFWQLYDGGNSRPFRETNYNPELFYRFKPQWNDAPGLGFDLGVDHQSNGKDLPESRSWNRIIGAAYYETDRQLVHLRLWYRLPENEDRAADDPARDDNPDIHAYIGYGELRLQRKFFGDAKHVGSLMLRGNPASGRGAVELVYSAPAPFSGDAFMMFYVWNGYGESLIDYNRSVTRVGIGLMLAR
ncbi:MAG: phospholipase A [Nevskiales bacterium]|nr:phospholipase A [Nevskiales bacterium]